MIKGEERDLIPNFLIKVSENGRKKYGSQKMRGIRGNR